MKLRTVVSAIRGALAWGAPTFAPAFLWPQPVISGLPYYTVAATETKVVRVRFPEGRNAREVLDFNLYLSPEDVWSAHISHEEARS